MNKLFRFLLFILIFTAISLTIIAQERPTATLKAQYDFITLSLNTKTGERIPSISEFILQISPTASYYYNPRTYYIDSLENDPQGKITIAEARDAAYRAFADDNTKRPFETLKNLGLVKESQYRCFKDFNAGYIRVWDSNMGDRYRYDIDMADLNWVLGDSTTNILGYECHLATADYHGRKWTAWFAPEIPSQDGPWQLCGLPGLIMEATCEGGLYSFVITGLQQCQEELKPSFEDERYFISNRKSVLKMRNYSRRNRAAQISAMTGGKVKLTNNVNYDGDEDLIETDYHE